MNYSRIYTVFISARKNRKISGKTEKHHITPRSLGGSDSKSNIIKLTAREHFFAHRLLAKIHGGKMWAALAYMSRGGTKSAKNLSITSREYEYIKKKDSEWRSIKYKGDGNPFKGKTFTEDQLDKMRGKRPSIAGKNNPNFGKDRSDVGIIISFIHRYKPNSVEVDLTVMNRIHEICGINETICKNGEIVRVKTPELKKLAEYINGINFGIKAGKRDKRGSKNPNYGNGQAISGSKNPMFGKTMSEETKEKIREKSKRKINCPHCNKIGSISNMKRWHFDNCRNKDTRT